MPLRDIGVIWVQPGVQPVTGYKPRSRHGSDIRAAIIEALSPPSDDVKNLVPWLRAGTGCGAEIVNRQGILMLRDIFNAGVLSGKKI